MALEMDAVAQEAHEVSGWARTSWPPFFLLAPAVLVAVAITLPIAYVVGRTFGAGTEAWDLLVRQSVLETLLRTVYLSLAVTASTVLIAVPVAWLTVRSDLPWKRFWSVLTVLPLVIPSYVGALVAVTALGPKGLVQQMLEGPLGIDRLPGIYGFSGALLVLTFLSFPYVLLSVRAALWNLDPAMEEAARGLGHSAMSTFRRVTLPRAACRQPWKVALAGVRRRRIDRPDITRPAHDRPHILGRARPVGGRIADVRLERDAQLHVRFDLRGRRYVGCGAAGGDPHRAALRLD
jgi:ABC-type spermidine/putrescine transport system permease subunit I